MIRRQAINRWRDDDGQKPTRSGFTLVELLVVILIMGLVAGIAVPVIAPTLDSRRLRETSRMISAYLQGARDTALRNGRPVGVMFERYVDRGTGTAVPQMSIVLRQVEVPPPYAGDFLNSRIQVANVGGTLQVIAFSTGDVGWQYAVRIGDLIKFNYQGPYYMITNGPLLSPDKNQFLAAPSGTNGWTIVAQQANAPAYLAQATPAAPAVVPFQIFRQPSIYGAIQKSANPALQLPESLVIDLQYSGIGPTGVDFRALDYTGNAADPNPADSSAVIITFTPSGSVERVYASRYAASGGFTMATSPINLLLGKRERVRMTQTDLANLDADTTPDGMANFRDLENYWISIYPQTGQVTVAQVGDASTTGYATPLAASRQFATTAQLAGGK